MWATLVWVFSYFIFWVSWDFCSPLWTEYFFSSKNVSVGNLTLNVRVSEGLWRYLATGVVVFINGSSALNQKALARWPAPSTHGEERRHSAHSHLASTFISLPSWEVNVCSKCPVYSTPLLEHKDHPRTVSGHLQVTAWKCIWWSTSR